MLKAAPHRPAPPRHRTKVKVLVYMKIMFMYVLSRSVFLYYYFIMFMCVLSRFVFLYVFSPYGFCCRFVLYWSTLPIAARRADAPPTG